MRFSCDIEGVEPAFRLLLTSDGTVTDMLQVICREPIKAKEAVSGDSASGPSI